MVNKKTKTALLIGGTGIILYLGNKYFNQNQSNTEDVASGSDSLGGQDTLGGGGIPLAYSDPTTGSRTTTTSVDGVPLDFVDESAPTEPYIPAEVPTDATTPENLFTFGLSDIGALAAWAGGTIAAEELGRAGIKKIKEKAKARNTAQEEIKTKTVNEELKAGRKTLDDAEVKARLKNIDTPESSIRTRAEGEVRLKAANVEVPSSRVARVSAKAGKVAGAAAGIIETGAVVARSRERYESGDYTVTEAANLGLLDAGTDVFSFFSGLVYRPKPNNEYVQSRQANTGWFATFRDVGQSVKNEGLGKTVTGALGINDLYFAITGKRLGGANNELDYTPLPASQQFTPLQTNMSVAEQYDVLNLNNQPVSTNVSRSVSNVAQAKQAISKGASVSQVFSTEGLSYAEKRRVYKLRQEYFKDKAKYSERGKRKAFGTVEAKELSESQKRRAGTKGSNIAKIIRRSGAVEYRIVG